MHQDRNQTVYEQQQSASICRQCGVTLQPGLKFCYNCGATQQEPDPATRCSACGAQLEGNPVFCPECGHRRVGQAQAAPTTPAVVHPPVTEIRANAVKSRKKSILIPVVAIVLVAIAVGLFFVLRGTPVKELEFEEDEFTLKEGESVKLSCTITPSDATDKTLTWESSDEDVAEVSEKGKVTAVGEGECTITATSSNGKTAECEITVEKAGPDFRALYNEYCDSVWAGLGNDGSYLTIDTNPYDWDDDGVAYSDAYFALQSINAALGLPDSLFQDMGSTSSSMGKQTETFESIGLTVSWTYHPDKGLEVTYKHINN